MQTLSADEKLVRAAGDLLVEIGPAASTVRKIAEKASVNHGLVHHYFRSKDLLLRAAMIQLLEEHRDFVKAESNGELTPPPMLLLKQRRYLRAVAHCVLDGQLDLALLEITEGLSVPQSALQQFAANHGGKITFEMKSQTCAAMALEMGWVLLEPSIFAVSGIEEHEIGDARNAAIELRRKMVGKLTV